MRPPKNTVQWIAPHLSESEVRAIYEMVLSQVVGEDFPVFRYIDGLVDDRKRKACNKLLAWQREAAAVLFGQDKN